MYRVPLGEAVQGRARAFSGTPRGRPPDRRRRPSGGARFRTARALRGFPSPTVWWPRHGIRGPKRGRPAREPARYDGPPRARMGGVAPTEKKRCSGAPAVAGEPPKSAYRADWLSRSLAYGAIRHICRKRFGPEIRRVGMPEGPRERSYRPASRGTPGHALPTEFSPRWAPHGTADRTPPKKRKNESAWYDRHRRRPRGPIYRFLRVASITP